MKILHIISNLMTGGAEKMLEKVILATAADGITHEVISIVSGGRVADELKSAGITIHSLGSRRSITAMAHLNTIRRIIQERQPDLIQGWMYHGNLMATAAAACGGSQDMPVLWNIRQSLKTLRNETLVTAITILAGSLLSHTTRGIIYNSVRAAQDHERFHYSRERRILIPNGFDTTLFYPNPSSRAALIKELALPGDSKIVGRVANYHLHKDFPTLFAAFAKIAQAEPQAHLVLVGRGLDPTNRELSSLIRSIPLEHRVHILGDRTDVACLMPGFDLFISSSSAEAFPNVIGEAMACGVPTVTTDAGDCRKILEDDTRVANASDSDALATKALNVLALDQAERKEIGLRDRRRVSKQYSLSKISTEYKTLWNKIVADSFSAAS